MRPPWTDEEARELVRAIGPKGLDGAFIRAVMTYVENGTTDIGTTDPVLDINHVGPIEYADANVRYHNPAGPYKGIKTLYEDDPLVFALRCPFEEVASALGRNDDANKVVEWRLGRNQ